MSTFKRHPMNKRKRVKRPAWTFYPFGRPYLTRVPPGTLTPKIRPAMREHRTTALGTQEDA